MGKQRYDPNFYPQQESNTRLKMMHKSSMKKVKITYISSPVMVKACDASEFRSVVQQLTGKDSNINNNKKKNKVHGGRNQIGYDNSSLVHQSMMQNEVGCASDDHGKGSGYYNNISMMTFLDLDEDYFWKELALSAVLPSSCVLV